MSKLTAPQLWEKCVKSHPNDPMHEFQKLGGVELTLLAYGSEKVPEEVWTERTSGKQKSRKDQVPLLMPNNLALLLSRFEKK